jgi:predicted PurR-regulated permease PerM
MEPFKTNSSGDNIEKTVNNILRLGLLFLLIGLCITFILPFSLILIWAAIIAITVYPAYNGLVRLFRGQKILASTLVTLVMLSIIGIPTWMITESMFVGIMHFRDMYQSGVPLITPPGDTVKDWPAIAQPIVNLWQSASENLHGLLIQHKDQLKELGVWLLAAISGFGKGVLEFLFSILIAAVFLVFSESLTNSSIKVFKKLAQTKGENFASLTIETVRSVVVGILGVAAIQAAMAGVAFYVADVPFAGLWTILCLMLSVIQIGSWPILIPMTVYVYTTTTPLNATLFAIWMIIVASTDNFLTPILMGRNSSVPMLVLLIGSMGGFITIGFLGLFLGAVILSIGYKLFITWLNTETQN